MRIQLATLALLAIVAVPEQRAAAQARVCVTGTVQQASGPSICGQPFTHEIDCSKVMLRSSAVNLNQFLGKTVELIGFDVGVTCPIIDVQQVLPAPATLIRCGSPTAGCPVKLKVCPVGIGQWWLFLSFAPGFAPLGCSNPSGGIHGTFLLGGPVFVIGSGAGTMCGETLLNIPLNNSLVGLQVFFQGARRNVGPIGPLQLTNPECFTIGPPSPACVLPNC